MANKRILASALFEDEFVGGLSFFGRLLWIGMFGTVADDQGRMVDSAIIIRARVFPYDTNLSDAQVEAELKKIEQAGKIIRYEAKGKRLIQFANWWKHQAPSWASPSQYPAPAGWTDRIKYHGAGNKIITQNWDKPGGMLHSDLPRPLCSGLNSGIEERKEEEEEEVRGEEEEAEGMDSGGGLPELAAAFTSATSLEADPQDEAFARMAGAGITPQDIQTAFLEVRGRYKITCPGSLVTAAAVVAQRRSQAAGEKRKDYTKGEFACLVNR